MELGILSAETGQLANYLMHALRIVTGVCAIGSLLTLTCFVLTAGGRAR